MANNFYKDKKGKYEIKPTTIETVDRAVLHYFSKKLNLRVKHKRDLQKVNVFFAGHERWVAIKKSWNEIKKNNFRDDKGVLILPILTINRLDIDREPGFGGFAQEVPEIVITKKVHKETSLLQNLVNTRRTNGFPRPKPEPIYEYMTIPYPDFCTIFYEVTIWTQYKQHMNQILENIFYNYDYRDSFVMPVDYTGKNPKGDGYYFVGFRDGNIVSQDNSEDFSDEERLIQCVYNFKVPAYFMLDPQEEALSYGKDEKGKKVVHKYQSATKISYKENIVTDEEFEKLFG